MGVEVTAVWIFERASSERYRIKPGAGRDDAVAARMSGNCRGVIERMEGDDMGVPVRCVCQYC